MICSDCCTSDFTVGFIGGGNMSTAIAQGIIKTGQSLPSRIWVSGPRLTSLKHWVAFGSNATTNNGEVLRKCNLVFFGVKPQMLKVAIQDCLQSSTGQVELSENIIFVSMLAGVTLDQLCEEFQVLTTNPRIIRIMPNTPMTVGAGACLYTPNGIVTDKEATLLDKMFSQFSVCSRVPESMMNTLGALTGCGPAYMFIVLEALADGAVKQGVPRDLAIRFAAQLMLGCGKMVLESGKHPGQLKDEVCSPGGSTIAGVTVLEDGKIRATMIKAIEASALKNKELSKIK